MKGTLCHYAPCKRLGLAAVAVLMVLAVGAQAIAATTYANPGDDIRAKISPMNPGDTLILNPGTYTYAGATMMLMTNKVGDASHWFTIKALQPNTVVIKGNSGRNVCEMRNSAYWVFQNLELDGQGVASDGIKCTANTGNVDTDWSHDILIDNLNIHNLTNACVNTQVTVWNLTVQNCWLHDAIGTPDAPGLGAYLGTPGHVQQIINLTFQHNLIERTGGYGIQIKAQNVRTGLTLGTTAGLTFTSWGWLIKDNVWMRTNPPAQAGRPNLLVDAGPASGSGSTDLATIEGNVVLAQTADATSDNAFQLSGNLRVVNNILMNTKGAPAIRIGSHDSSNPRNLALLNNTVFIDGSAGGPCLSLYNLQTGYTQVIANNAFIRGDTSATAVSTDGSYVASGAILTNNIARGTGYLPGMTTITTPISQIFTGTTDVPGTANFYPIAGSPLIDAGSNTYAAALDFNGATRPQGAGADVVAYEYYLHDNPGWQLADTFKRVGLAGDTDGDGHVDVVDLLNLVASFGTVTGDAGYSAACDFNSDGSVDVVDLLMLVNSFGL
jgi:hypothetical protein